MAKECKTVTLKDIPWEEIIHQLIDINRGREFGDRYDFLYPPSTPPLDKMLKLIEIHDESVEKREQPQYCPVTLYLLGRLYGIKIRKLEVDWVDIQKRFYDENLWMVVIKEYNKVTLERLARIEQSIAAIQDKLSVLAELMDKNSE